MIIGATNVTLATQDMHSAMVDEILLTVELQIPHGEEELTDDIQMCSSAGLSEVKIVNRRSTEPSLMAQSSSTYNKRKQLGARSMSSTTDVEMR